MAFVLLHYYDDNTLMDVPISCSVLPRKDYADYAVGEVVTSKCPRFPGKFQAEIKEISDDRSKLVDLKKILRCSTKETNNEGTSLSCQEKNNEKGMKRKHVDVMDGNSKKGKETMTLNEKKKRDDESESNSITAQGTESKVLSVKKRDDKKRDDKSDNKKRDDKSESDGNTKKAKHMESTEKKKRDDESDTSSKVLESVAQKNLAEKYLQKFRENKSEVLVYPKVDHKDCVPRKELQDVKDDMKKMRSRIRTLESAMAEMKANRSTGILEESTASRSFVEEAANSSMVQEKSRQPMMTPSPSLHSFFPSTSSPIPKLLASTVKSSTSSPILNPSYSSEVESSRLEQECLFNGHTSSSLKDSIAHIDKLYDAVRCLLLKLFPKEYILSHSVSGKAPNKKTAAKPCFDYRLFSQLVLTLQSKFGSSFVTKDITEKVHSVQKSLK